MSKRNPGSTISNYFVKKPKITIILAITIVINTLLALAGISFHYLQHFDSSEISNELVYIILLIGFIDVIGFMLITQIKVVSIIINITLAIIGLFFMFQYVFIPDKVQIVPLGSLLIVDLLNGLIANIELNKQT